MSRKVAVILSGCGVYDGAEIHEAVCALLALNRAGATAVCAAPNVEFDEIDHITGQPTGKKRNALVEAARIARGQIRDVALLHAEEFDAALLPGGFGAAKNLSTFATAGADCTVEPATAEFLRAMKAAGKPIGALCIAPVVLARLFGPDFHPQVTIGNEKGPADAINSMGARHIETPASSVSTTFSAHWTGRPHDNTASGGNRMARKYLIAPLFAIRPRGFHPSVDRLYRSPNISSPRRSLMCMPDLSTP